MDQLDEAILRAFADWRTPWLNKAATDLTSLGSMTVAALVSVTAFTLLWIIPRDRVGATRMVTAFAGAQIWVEVLKRILQRPRPTIIPHLVESAGFSFPSGHALVATVTYGTLAAIACRYVRQPPARLAIRLICWTIAGLVAISRVYLGVHYPSDVLGGVLLGIAWLLITSKYSKVAQPPQDTAG